ncbi:hypothetical protein DH2020_008561 [Rehmannia glutinosa]|uniref:Transmembrane protein n=1 Tax=Rehmannia glutinosa TaxID=99300 RepID=A0ABR0X3S2_REHGL
MDRGQFTLIGSTICVMLTLHFSIQLVSQHYLSWKKPKEQKAIIIIALMTPFICYRFLCRFARHTREHDVFHFLGFCQRMLRGSGEVMAKFLGLMYTYLNISISKNIVPDEIKGREIHHSFPMTLFQPHTVRLDHKNLKLLKDWTWQFVVIRPVCSVLMISFQLLGIYPGWLSWTFTIILNVSVSLALYSLVVFYHVFAKELAPHKPLAKFLCVKGIVFFCFWQGFVLDILVAMEIVKSNHFWLDVEHLEEALQNMLVIVEMVFFSLFMQYAYTAEPYRTGSFSGTSDKKKE